MDLSDGFVTDYEIECPKHAGTFDYRTGEAKRLPACKNLASYATRVEEGLIQIQIPKQNSVWLTNG